MTAAAARRRDPERGDGPVSAAVIAPVFLAVIFLAVQAGLWGHARTVASAAAQVGAVSARGMNATAEAGAAARAYLAQTSGGLSDVTVTAARSDQVTVTVTGTAPTLVPGVRLRVDATSSVPVERLTTAGAP